MKEAAKVLGVFVSILAIIYGVLAIWEWAHNNYVGDPFVGILILAGGLTGAWVKWGR